MSAEVTQRQSVHEHSVNIKKVQSKNCLPISFEHGERDFSLGLPTLASRRNHKNLLPIHKITCLELGIVTLRATYIRGDSIKYMSNKSNMAGTVSLHFMRFFRTQRTLNHTSVRNTFAALNVLRQIDRIDRTLIIFSVRSVVVVLTA